MNIDDILKDLVQRRGSDLHLKVGRPPLMRLSNDLLPTEYPPLTPADIDAVLRKLLGEEGYQRLMSENEYDGAYMIAEVARFRLNAFRKMGEFGVVMRAIPLIIPSIDGMGLPAVLKDVCAAPQGLVLVTGPTGSGKSTTLAAMVNHINESQSRHVVTIEDPVEFVYTDRMCTFSQRQLGNDVKSVHEALRRVLRQDPDVILIGEMRDRETIELAMHAAETGHLVFSTLHTNDAKQTLDRIVDTFPVDGHHQVRSMLALTLRAVICQRLLTRADGNGRVAGFEIMVNSPNIRDLIQEGKTRELDRAIATGGEYYRMQTFNQALARLVHYKLITEDEAMACSTNPGDLRLLIKGIASGSAALQKGSPDTGQRPAPQPEGKFKITKGF